MIARPLLSLLLISTLWTTPSLAAQAPSSFRDDPAVVEFAYQMAARHGFSAAELLRQFAQIKPNAKVLQLIKPPTTPTQRSWARYQPRFLNERRIERGLQFWITHRETLEKAQQRFGVPVDIIVAIIGVETEYGRNTGGFRTLEALATLAFEYPPRADFFRTELEQFLLLSRENSLDPLQVKGSFAGAIGIPQFMPGSQRRYAVDFDGDARIDLSQSAEDAIGSVGRFLEQHGWRSGGRVAVPANVTQDIPESVTDAGIRPTFTVAQLASHGIYRATEQTGQAAAEESEKAALIDLVSPDQATEYWLGFDNFYVITRYNRSSFYAMAVFQLAEALRQRRNGE